MYEELMRIPFIVKMPGGSRAGSRTQSLVSHVDILPTILDLCRAEVPDVLQGFSLLPLIQGEADSVRDGIAGEYHSANWTNRIIPLRMWRDADRKYIEKKDRDDELYNLKEDPLEMEDLAHSPGSADVLASMRRRLHEWLEQSDDRFPEVPVPPDMLVSRGRPD